MFKLKFTDWRKILSNCHLSKNKFLHFDHFYSNFLKIQRIMLFTYLAARYFIGRSFTNKFTFFNHWTKLDFKNSNLNNFPRKRMLRINNSLKNRLSWVQMMDFNPKDQIETAHAQHFTISKWVINNLFKIYTRTTGYTCNTAKAKEESYENPVKKEIHKFVIASMNKDVCHPIMYPLGVYYLYHYMMKEDHDIPTKKFLVYFSVCVSLASKMYEDHYYYNYHYMNFFWDTKDMKIEEFNQVEVMILKFFKYNLFISYEDLKLFLIQNSL